MTQDCTGQKEICLESFLLLLLIVEIMTGYQSTYKSNVSCLLEGQRKYSIGVLTGGVSFVVVYLTFSGHNP
jgi:hypothetical protein